MMLRSLWHPRPTHLAAIAGAVAVVALLVGVRVHSAQQYSGDEPHYLLIANSLILDGDVDVKNDYLTQRYLRFVRSPLDWHVNTSLFTPDSPHWYSQHGVGVPAILVPGIVLDNAIGANVTMALIAAAVLVLAFLWAKRFVGSARWALAATAALGLSPVFLGLQSRIFPDLATAALLLGCLLLLELRGRRPWHLFALGTLIGISPWMHFKNGLPFGLLLAVALVQIALGRDGADRARRALLLCLPAFTSAVGYELAVHDWYGSWLPTRMFPPGTDAFALDPARGIAASSFDASRGLFSNGPALILVLAGLPLWLRQWRGPFARLALVLGPTILIQATFKDWSAGFAPAGRYPFQFAPALVPAIALFLREVSGAVRALASTLLLLQVSLAGAFVWFDPSWSRTGERSQFFALLDDHIGIAVDRLMPTFDSQGSLLRGAWQLSGWTAVSVALVVYGALLSRVRRRLAAAPTPSAVAPVLSDRVPR